MTRPEQLRVIAEKAREIVQRGAYSASICPCEGWTIVATRAGVRLAHPRGIVDLPDAWVDGRRAADGHLAAVLESIIVEVVA